MFRIEVLIGRNVADHIDVNAICPDPAIKQQLIIFAKVSDLKARIQISLPTAVPMTHHGNVALL